MKMMDLTGHRYGKLVVIKRGPPHISPSRKQVTWECVCDCGQRVVVKRGGLRNGNTISCGCAIKDLGIRKRTSCYTHRAEYFTWSRMKQRCENKNSADYPLYGARGIKVCDRWRNSFDEFLADMGPRPTTKHSIDRIDSDGDYEPGNCRWATGEQQSRNKRNNVYLELNGKRQVLADWARDLGIQWTTLHERLRKHPLEIALTAEKGMKNGS